MGIADCHIVELAVRRGHCHRIGGGSEGRILQEGKLKAVRGAHAAAFGHVLRSTCCPSRGSCRPGRMRRPSASANASMAAGRRSARVGADLIDGRVPRPDRLTRRHDLNACVPRQRERDFDTDTDDERDSRLGVGVKVHETAVPVFALLKVLLRAVDAADDLLGFAVRHGDHAHGRVLAGAELQLRHELELLRILRNGVQPLLHALRASLAGGRKHARLCS